MVCRKCLSIVGRREFGESLASRPGRQAHSSAQLARRPIAQYEAMTLGLLAMGATRRVEPLATGIRYHWLTGLV